MNVCIGGRGKKNAPFLVVGQNPGGDEDLAGKPFVGRSGKLLIEMLKEAGFKGEDIRLTNAVRCASPKNREPEKEEIDVCNEYLIDEVRSVRPMVIIAVGNVALRALCRLSGLSDKRGKSFPLHEGFDLPSIEVWPVYHPAFVLRSPNYRGVVIQDLRRIRNSFLKAEELVYTENEMPKELGEFVAWDIETDYDHAKKTGGENVTQSAYSFRDREGIIRSSVSTSSSYSDIVLHCRENRTLVTHNGYAFDLPKCGFDPQGRDTMVLAALDDESQPRSLEALACKYGGAVPWKDAKTALLGSEEYKQYNVRDAYWTLIVHEKLCERLGPRVKIADRIILPAVLATRACSKRGLFVSQKVVTERLEHFLAEERDSLAAVQEYVGDVSGWCRNTNKTGLAYKKPTKFNPGSTNHVSEYFCHKNIMTEPTESGKAWRTDAKALEHAVLPKEFREPLETYRHARKMRTTYLEPLTKLGEDGRLHPEYYLYARAFDTGKEGGGTASGRPTASHNVLTLPREFKNIGLYNAPKGNILVEADHGSIEFRLAAWYAGAETILRNYCENPYWDPHSWFARPFYGLPENAEVDKSKRQVAKSANFSLWFCGYWKTMQEYAAGLGINLPQTTCQRAYETFHTLIPEAVPWWGHVLNEVRKNGYIETPTGRRRHFGAWENIPFDMRESVKREAVNMLPQSLASDITLLGLAECHKEGLPIVHTWYDAIYFELDEFENDSQKSQFEATVRECMIARPLNILKKEFGCDLTVPLVVEIKYIEQKD